jgi:hypothetical protein
MKLTIRMFRPIRKLLRIMASHRSREHSDVAIDVCDVGHAPNRFGSRGLRIANRGSGFCFEAFSARGWTAKIKVRDVPHGAFTVTGDKTLNLDSLAKCALRNIGG